MGWLTEGFPEEVTSELSPDGKNRSIFMGSRGVEYSRGRRRPALMPVGAWGPGQQSGWPEQHGVTTEHAYLKSSM